MQIGSIGDIQFKVDNASIFTFSGLSRTRSANYAQHQVLRGKPRVQHIGGELDALSFTVLLHSVPAEKVSVDSRIKSLMDMFERGEEQALVLGNRYWGLWVLKGATVQHREIHNGITLSARVTLELLEYN